MLLQTLFQTDQILYTIVPVTGKEDLERAYIENSEGVGIVQGFHSVLKYISLLRVRSLTKMTQRSY